MSAFDDVQSNNEQARRDALDALARGGTAGVQALQDAKANVRSDQQSALDQALNGAAQRGAPQAAQDQWASIIREPGDRYAQALDAATGTLQADMARRATANDDYFRQAGAAVPAIQAATARAVALAQAAWGAHQAKQQDPQWEQNAITKGLAEIQAEGERSRRLNDIKEQQAYLAAPASNPTFDPIGAALAQAAGVGTPDQQAQYEHIIANPMEGATYFAGGGTKIPVTPTLADPHYMGHGLDDAQRQLAAEIAATRVPADVQSQRDAYLAAYGDDLRHQALARGLFAGPEEMTPAQRLADAQTRDKLDYYGHTGYTTPQEQAAAMNAQRDLSAPSNDRELAAKAGIDDPSDIAKIRGSSEYQQMMDIAQKMVSDPSQQYSVDDIKLALNYNPAWDKAPEVKKLVLAEVSGLTYSPQFLPKPNPLTGG